METVSTVAGRQDGAHVSGKKKDVLKSSGSNETRDNNMQAGSCGSNNPNSQRETEMNQKKGGGGESERNRGEAKPPFMAKGNSSHE